MSNEFPAVPRRGTIFTIVGIIVILLPPALLFWCVERHAYVYYQILRWVVCLSAISVIGYLVERNKKRGTPPKGLDVFFGLVFGIVALVFNPLIPFSMSRETWVTIDVITGFIFVFAYLYYLIVFIISREK